MAGNHPSVISALCTSVRKVMLAASKSFRSPWRFRQAAIAVMVGLSAMLAIPQGAFASNGPHFGNPGSQHPSPTQQDPAWLRAKVGYRVWSGITPGQGKGTGTHPQVLATSMIDLSKPSASASPNAEFPPVPGEPSSYMLNLGWEELYTAEPSDGTYQNVPGTENPNDDAGHPYNDWTYYTWCGVGASDVALEYWPYPPNFLDSSQVHDPMLPGQYSSWNAYDSDGTYRLRGYMIYLADQTKAPDWAESGMLTQSYNQSGEPGGVTLQVVQDALNWEASGHGSGGNWSNYFYTTQWNSAYYGQGYPNNLYNALHQQIEVDLAQSHVPVLVELPAGYLSNWPSNATVYHMVAIVGYDDTSNTYYYIDTCKQFTHCNRYGTDTPDAHPVDELKLEQGVASITTNQTTGDGGWVW